MLKTLQNLEKLSDVPGASKRDGEKFRHISFENRATLKTGKIGLRGFHSKIGLPHKREQTIYADSIRT